MTFNPTKDAALLEDVILVALRDANLITDENMDIAFKSERIADLVREALSDAYHEGCRTVRASVMMSIGEEP